MPRKPRIKDINTESLAPGDPVTTVMAMLLPVHSAMTLEWLVDATATAAERTVNAAYTFVYFEEDDGALAYRAPASDTRRRGVQRAIDAFGVSALTSKIDPATATAIAEALESPTPVNANAGELLRGLVDDGSATKAQAALGVDSVSLVKLESAGERLGALLLLHVGTPNLEHVRLLGEHVACAAVNLRQAQAAPEASTADVVRTVFDARKTEIELQRELMRAERYRREASICVIEATNLRLLRERFGPGLVEGLYDRVGQALAQHSRDIDVLGQYKSSGYTMILSEASPEAAALATTRLLAIAQEAARDANVPGLELHLAAGHATYPADGKATDAVFAAAERRMYAAAA
ncbi:MAG: diguanylate cyclase [Chloroflexi bacterium]|nr:diguanylate cyclase [Chloroflexota bacterium]